MENKKKRYRCTFPKWATVKVNGKPWSSQSEAMYGNSDGMCLASTYYSQLMLLDSEYFDSLDDLLYLWKYWKEKREEYVKLSREANNPYFCSDFFYRGHIERDAIVVTWGWTDSSPAFTESYGEDKLCLEITIRITDVKVDLDDFGEIPEGK